MTDKHELSEVREIPANESGRGNLAGFEIHCSCGFAASNTVRTNVQADARDHLSWAQHQIALDLGIRKEVSK